MAKRILLTGATGFIGQHLYPLLLQKGYEVRRAVRSLPLSKTDICTGEINRHTRWAEALIDIDTVIHLAGKAHSFQTDESAYYEVNAYGTQHLADCAVKTGVRRFIYVSTLHINGERTPPEHPFTEKATPVPRSAYACSKWEAEKALIALQESLEIVIVRPPLVYGAGVRANFLRLIKLVNSGLPLPFKNTTNRRSLIAVTNLTDFLAHCIEPSGAAGEVFLVSDGKDVSTETLIQQIADALNRPAHLWPLPSQVAKATLAVLRKQRLFEQLWGSLTVDITKASQRLGWQPPVTMTQELRQVARWYRQL